MFRFMENKDRLVSFRGCSRAAVIRVNYANDEKIILTG
jgi:hypothetical protein